MNNKSRNEIKKIMVIAVVGIIAVNSFGAGMAQRVKYCYAQTVSADVPSLNTLVELTDKSDGVGVRFKWKTEFAPTKETLVALDGTAVDAWIKSTTDVVKSENVYTSDQGLLLRAFIAMLKVKNPSLVLPSKTKVKAKYLELKTHSNLHQNREK